MTGRAVIVEAVVQIDEAAELKVLLFLFFRRRRLGLLRRRRGGCRGSMQRVIIKLGKLAIELLTMGNPILSDL
jgi:hypothetical protein